MQGAIAAMRHPDFQDAANDATLALYRPLSDAAAKTRLASRIIHSLPYVWQYNIGDFVMNPGRLRHFYFRKKEIEKLARKSVCSDEKAATAGDCSLAPDRMCCSQWAGARISGGEIHRNRYEGIAGLQAGGVQGTGRRATEQCGIPRGRFAPSTRRYIGGIRNFIMLPPKRSGSPRDFSCSFRKRTWPGYLREVKPLSAAGSHIIFTSLRSKKTTHTAGHLLQTLYLHKEKSPFQWAMPFDNMPVFINNLGYHMARQIPCDALQKTYMRQKFNHNHVFGEDIHIAININM